MVFAIKPGLVPSLEQSLHCHIQEATARACLEAYAANNLLFIGTGLILQQEITFEQGKIVGTPRKASHICTKRAILRMELELR
jgi:hypothetical protein